MKEIAARTIAQDLGGEPRLITDDNWCVIIRREDGRLVMISDLGVWEYADEEAFRQGHADKTIPLVVASPRWR